MYTWTYIYTESFTGYDQMLVVMSNTYFLKLYYIVDSSEQSLSFCSLRHSSSISFITAHLNLSNPKNFTFPLSFFSLMYLSVYTLVVFTAFSNSSKVKNPFGQSVPKIWKNHIFKASALWADAFYKSKCPYVCVSVCLSVHF